MHSLELTALATNFVRHAEEHLGLCQAVSRPAAEAYWLATRFRQEAWSERLAAHRTAIQRPGIAQRHARWREILPVMQEILISEPLTRCIAYQAKVLEQRGADIDFSSYASSALSSHVESRHRCLHLIVFGTGLSPELAVSLNRLRRIMEQFNDQLLILLRPHDALATYCFDLQTTHMCQRQLGHKSDSSFHRRLHASLLRNWVTSICSRECALSSLAANPRFNALVSQAVLRMFPSDMFDSLGFPNSQQTRQFRATSPESDATQIDAAKPDVSPLELLAVNNPRQQLLEPDDRRW